MKLSIDVNVRLTADDGLVRLLRDLLAPRPDAAPAFLPKPDEAPRPEPVLSEKAASRMLDGPSPKPTPIPPHIARTSLHPVTQEALAALGDDSITRKAVDAVARRDGRAIAESRPVPVRAITPDALAKPSRTITTKPAATADTPPDGYLPVDDACAAHGGIHFTTLYARVKAGTVQKVKVGRRSYFSPPTTAAAGADPAA